MMDKNRDRIIREIFASALEIEDAARRTRYLAEACAGDLELRQEVESLLGAYTQAGQFLQSTPAQPAGTARVEAPGTVIGRYRLLEEIGEGGFGVVYRAEQLEPVRRTVALKIIKQGMDTREVTARFETERQALAMMNHPNIASVLDAGATASGRPYFVMELVPGISLTDYCDGNNLGTDARLALFVKVCHAVQHAHQKGIIHRDLKPSNILVGLQDGEAVPKIIDFGVAKAVGHRLTSNTLVTRIEQLVGTPVYMSPEQAEASAAGAGDVDTRADIYALGVLLYELLTGTTPFETERLKQVALDEVRRVIRETEPPKPSTRLRALGARLPEVAQRRQTAPVLLPKLVRGDLDWIVMKALEKDRSRRYETVGALALDIQHYLHHEPVTVGPPGRLYRLRKFVRRHRSGVTIVSLVLLALLATLSAALLGLGQARKERNRAVAAEAAAKATLKRMDIQRVREFFGRNDSANGVALLAWLVRQHPQDRALAEWLLNELTQRSLPLPAQEPLRHPDSVLLACFSPDGRRLLTTARNNTAQIWDTATGQPVSPPLQHAPGLVRSDEFRGGLHPISAAFSPDAQRVVTASIDNTARIWDAQTGQPTTSALVHPDWVTWARFSPDGRWVATACKDGAARLWDARTGELVGRPFQHSNWVNTVEFSPDGRLLLTASDDNTAQVWEVPSGQPVGQMLRHLHEVRGAIFSPDDQRVLTFSADTTARIWDVRTGEPLTPPLQHDYIVTSGQFSPDGLLALTASFDNTARLWDGYSGRPMGPVLRHNSVVRSARFSPEGQRIVTASEDKTARVWDVRTGEPLSEPLRHLDLVWTAEFSPDGHRVVTASADQTAQLWDVRPGQALGHCLLFNAKVLLAQWSADSRRVLTLSEDRCDVADAATGTGLEDVALHQQRGVLHAQFSPDGLRLATASQDHTARVWDSRTGRALSRPMRHDDSVLFVEFSPDGQRLASASADHTARLWNAQTGEPAGPPLSHRDVVPIVRFSPLGQHLATASGSAAFVWSVHNGQLTAPLLRHDNQVQSVAFSPDGHRMVTASKDHSARIWDVRSAVVLTPWLTHNGAVASARFSPDGKLVLTASTDNTARLWDSHTGRLMSDPMTHEAEVVSAEFSPDGRRVLTASLDGNAQIWDVPTGQPLGEPFRHRRRLNAASFSPDGLRVVTASHDWTARIWENVHATPPAPDWLPALAEAVIGSHLDGQRVMERVLREEFFTLRERLLQVAGQGELGRWAQWFLADRSTRPVAPSAQRTVPEFVHDLLRCEVRPYNLVNRLTALKLMPTNAVAFAEMAETFARERTTNAPRQLAAIDWCSRQALTLSPEHPAAWRARALFLERSGQTNAALAALAEGSRFASKAPDYWGHWAWLLEAAGQLEDACQKFTQALEMSEGLPGSDTMRFTWWRWNFLKRHPLFFSQHSREALAHWRRMRGIPDRATDCPPELIDLTQVYNAGLDQSWLNQDLYRMDLRDLPHGRQRLAGVEFDIRGVAQGSSAALELLKPGFYPTNWSLPIGLKRHRLHFLHAADVPESEGAVIGYYRIQYADAQAQAIPITYGKDVLAWLLEESAESISPVVALCAAKPNGIVLQITKSTWENPRPDLAIESLDFISTMTGSAPFLLAVTAEP